MHLHTNAYTEHRYTHVYTHTCICWHARIHMNTIICTHTHKHTHTQIHAITTPEVRMQIHTHSVRARFSEDPIFVRTEEAGARKRRSEDRAKCAYFPKGSHSKG